MKLVSLGRLQLTSSPSASLAYTIASLEWSDNGPARRFALEALAQGPPALQLPASMGMWWPAWSPDGRWIVYYDDIYTPACMYAVSRDTGERRLLSQRREIPVGFTQDSRRLVTYEETAGNQRVLRVWTFPDAKLQRTFPPAENTEYRFAGQSDTLLRHSPSDLKIGPSRWFRVPLDGGAEAELGRWDPKDLIDLALSTTSIVSLHQGGRILEQPLDGLSLPPRVIGTHEGATAALVHLTGTGGRVLTRDRAGEVRIWDSASGRLERTLQNPRREEPRFAIDPAGRFLVMGPRGSAGPRSVFLFDLDAPRTAEPMPLLRDWTFINAIDFSPDGSWLATVDSGHASLWNMSGRRSTIVGRQAPPFLAVAFTADGHLVSTSDEGVVRRWPTSWAGGEDVREYRLAGQSPVLTDAKLGASIDVDRRGRFAVVVQRTGGHLLVVPLDGSAPRAFPLGGGAGEGRLDPSGRFVALRVDSGRTDGAKNRRIRVIDLETRESRELDTRAAPGQPCTEFNGFALPAWLPDGRLVTDGANGLREWNLATGESRQLRPCGLSSEVAAVPFAAPDGRSVLRLVAVFKASMTSSLTLFDLAARTTRTLDAHGNLLVSVALDATGKVLVTGDAKGTVRVGMLAGGEPHLLYGHTAAVTSVAVSPDGRWIGSGSDDGTIRLWPMPDLKQTPPHTLPYDQFMARLRTRTNLGAVPNPGSDTGWKIEVGPFTGWKHVPTW